ncbi:MAG: CoA-binding protein, partial [Spirochaetota bacterium]|nr:CoA-binding protein [Spirochaetota bacterium]
MIDEYLKEDVFAVVGASPNTEKYGYKIYKHLQSLGKKVYPVHPAAREIDG